MANGYTTVQDGKTDPGSLAMLMGAAKAGKLKIDVVSYADLVALADSPMLRGPLMSRSYTDHFRIGGVKLTLDGSPQGKTAWFTQPYFVVPAGQKPDYAGYPAFPKPGEAQGWVDTAFRNNWQLLVHANGDAAIDQLIATAGVAEKAYPGTDRRTVLIHGQYLRVDQIPELKALGIFPALFPMHTFYWGDWHRESVAGPARAEFISPTNAVLKAGMKVSIHHDAPVTFPNSMRVLDSAVNRTTRTGHVLGPDQRLSPSDALKAMTIWPAYQHFEEATKGSIETGKVADLVILDKNPLTVPRPTLKDIKVVETIKGGTTVYTAN
jgi:predicted amidohydrolase YtcJ